MQWWHTQLGYGVRSTSTESRVATLLEILIWRTFSPDLNTERQTDDPRAECGRLGQSISARPSISVQGPINDQSFRFLISHDPSLLAEAAVLLF